MWIKTNSVNLLNWEVGKIPFGMTPARPNQWTFGLLPKQIGQEVFAQVMANIRNKTLRKITRDKLV